MTTYLAADLHLDHAGVLEYTDRPFGSVAEMNGRLVDGWNAVVGRDSALSERERRDGAAERDRDEVIFVGDLAVPSEPTTVQRWLHRLRGDVVFVAGDHDDGARRSRTVSVCEAYHLEVDGHRLYCIHDPDDAPPDRDGWLVHGHHHDMRLEEYPFVDPERERVNVSIELLGYEPLPLEELVGYLDRRRRLRRRPTE